MANATQRVPSSVLAYEDCRIYRVPDAVAQTWFGGAMVHVRTADGIAVKGGDVAGCIFDGILEDTLQHVISAQDTLASMAKDQSKKLPVLRPWRFRMAIIGATQADVGKKVYAKDDNLVQIAATTNSILVGSIDQVVSSTEVLITPNYNMVK